MNLRIENLNLRFKISEDELRSLIDGEVLETNALITVKVKVSEYGDDLSIDYEGRNLTLEVPKSKLLELSSMGRNRDGISASQAGISLSLQVDVRKDSRKKP